MTEHKWHAMTENEAAKELMADISKGLAPGEAARRLSAHGPNTVIQAKGKPAISMFLEQFQDFMVLVLLGATVVSALLGEVEDAVTILAIVILNAVLGFVQEFRAEKSLAALKQLASPMGRVIRGGKTIHIPSAGIVPGDILLLEAGDRVPADCRLLEAVSLEVEESALTGESLPVKKRCQAIRGEAVSLGDRNNIAHSSTVVTQGRGKGLVFATGMSTELGKIAKLIHEAEDEDTPLQKRLEYLGKWLVGVCLALCSLVVIAGVLRGESWERMFLTGVSLAVAAIPEGLPAIVTIALAIGVQRMIRRKAIIRRLPAVETLGCTTVICSDKTGTLTQNAMTVTKVWTAGHSIDVTGNGYEPKGDFIRSGMKLEALTDPELKSLLLASGLCNNSGIVQGSASMSDRFRKGSGEKRWQAEGDPTESALMALSIKGGLDKGGGLSKWRRIHEIPFSSDRRMMSVICRDPSGNTVNYIKGAPDVIVARCTHYMKGGRVVPLTPSARDAVLKANEEFARGALRVLGLAVKYLGNTGILLADGSLEEGLVLVGLAGMMDPPREEAKSALKVARKAGIRTVMITGDHKTTAVAIAAQMGLYGPGSRAVTGDELDAMSDEQLAAIIEGIPVYARVSPGHKLRIVKAWKRKGHIVAMTGDGVNDAPAVKEADIGVSMGISGTDVTKEASSMILADDNYATIVAAVEEGRSIYSNIRKFIRYLLACNIGEVLTMFLATVAGLPLPLLPMQILWTNLVTDGLPALALGVDPPEKGVMEQPPRGAKEGIFSGGLQQKIMATGLSIALCTLVSFAYGSWGPGGYLVKGQTMAFTTLVMSQLVFVFNCRSERKSIFELGFFSNPYLVMSVLVSLAMQLSVIYVPALQTIFKTTGLGGSEWLIISILSCWSLVMVGVARISKRVIGKRIALFRA